MLIYRTELRIMGSVFVGLPQIFVSNGVAIVYEMFSQPLLILITFVHRA